MGAWPGGQLEGHVGPGREGASGWRPHPSPLAPKQLVALCQVPLATLPGSLGSKPISPLCRHPCPRPGFHRLLWRLSVSLPTLPG